MTVFSEKSRKDEITASSVFSVSGHGELIYQQGKGGSGERHVWVDESGRELSQVSEPSIYGSSRLSPDGSRIATEAANKNAAQPLWVWDLKGGTRAPLTPDSDNTDAMVWSADTRDCRGQVDYLALIPQNCSRDRAIARVRHSNDLPAGIDADRLAEAVPTQRSKIANFALRPQGSAKQFVVCGTSSSHDVASIVKPTDEPEAATQGAQVRQYSVLV